MGPQDYLTIGMGYVKTGLSFIREWIVKIINFTGIDGQLGTMILMLAFSLLLGRIIVKRFVTKPYSGSYLIWSLIISLLFFIILMYL